jgi:capsular polysaccharide transport system permease protein
MATPKTAPPVRTRAKRALGRGRQTKRRAALAAAEAERASAEAHADASGGNLTPAGHVDPATGEPSDVVAGAPTADPAALPPPQEPQAAPAVESPPFVARRRRGVEAEPPPQLIIRPMASRARPRTRHWMVLLSFLLCVVLPGLAAASYLWIRAEDQYGSTVAFSIRSEESRASSTELLGQLAQLSGVSSSDTDILYQFIQSQELVEHIDARLNLREMFSRPYQTDPVFAFDSTGTIEDLVDHWERTIDIAYEPATGLMEITARAFDPVEAQTIAQAILDESIARINELSAIAREDATRYAREELNASRVQLTGAREAMTAFRMRNQIIDPTADIQGQMGLLNTLQVELANSLIELDLLRETTREGDPRIQTVERRIDVIRDRISDERSRFGAGGEGRGGDSYAQVVAEYERLTVDLQFAEAAFASARDGYDAALAAAQRNSRYLAAHVKPTLAERARYPQRPTILALTVFFALLTWAIGSLIYYSARDRR